MIAVTGTSGHLGRLIVEALLSKGQSPGSIVALARDPARLSDLAAKGVVTRTADYTKPETLGSALAGVTKLVLVSSSEVGQRAAQHQNVIDAAKAAGVQLIAYTSILRADTSPLALAPEHAQTEAAIKASGIPYIFLRHGWYSENYAADIQGAAQHGAMIGATGNGKISAATRKDYAEADAEAILNGTPGSVLELAGSTGFTRQDLVAAIREATGKDIAYTNLAEADLATSLEGFGLPGPLAQVLAQCDAKAAEGWLQDDSDTLGRLIGRQTTPIKDTVRAILAA